MPAATFPAASAPLVLVLLLLLAPARPLTAQTATLTGRVLEQDAMLNLMPCAESSSSDDCLPRRGRTVPVHAFIDELLVFGLLQLGTWEPHEFYRVDFFDCGGYYVIRAYTYEYINRTSRRVQALLPPCMIPPLPA